MKRRRALARGALAGAFGGRDAPSDSGRGRRARRRVQVRVYDERGMARGLDAETEPGRAIAAEAEAMLDAAGV